MRTWIWLTQDERCGNCGLNLPQGSAAHKIELRGVKQPRYRGECCAGQAPPTISSSPVLHDHRDDAFFARLAALAPNRTRGSLRDMAKEFLPHPDD